MSELLQQLHLAPVGNDTPFSGLVSVKDDSLPPTSIPEHVARRDAELLQGAKDENSIGIDYIFFRRFGDGRSPQITAYVVDNSKSNYSEETIAELHRRAWLHGAAPLIYVEWPTRVDILRCAAGPEFWNQRKSELIYSQGESIQITSEIGSCLEETKVRRFSAYRLASGTFWEDPENTNWASAEKAAHRRLLNAAIDADRVLQSEAKPSDRSTMRRLLLLFIFTKYLEDRGVFPNGWFGERIDGASSFLDLLKTGSVDIVKAVLAELKEKFNGDIFELPELENALSRDVLIEFVTLLEAKTLQRQRYLWEQYSFRYIPVEVLSHLYQHFAQSGTGAIYTPPFVADLILDQVMPYEELTGEERILDPTCGSGIFLVGAFRRQIHYWQSHNDWGRPGVPVLKKILSKSIFGVEMLNEAAHVAALNLALAICEALQPKVIWNHLKFDKLIGKNLFVGDFFGCLDQLEKAAPDGFSSIIGNPPFHSELTPAAEATRQEGWSSIKVPDGNIAYRVLEECPELLSKDGKLCLLQPSGILYNSKARAFTAHFLKSRRTDTVLDFVSIRNLFEKADTKAVALLVRREEPASDHEIRHITFRRTKSVHERLGFELDHYDYHSVPQNIAVEEPWIWKANLLGGSRIVSLGRKANTYECFRKCVTRFGWDYGEGFIQARTGKRDPAPWLTGKPYLPTGALKPEGIVGPLGEVEATEFRSAYTPRRYTAPIILIRANEQLPMVFRSEGFLAYRDKILGVSAETKDQEKLSVFFEGFVCHKDIYRFLIYLFSTQMLVGKSTAFLKRDLDELPSPDSNFFADLSWWEKLLIEDVLEHFVEMIRTGQSSKLTLEKVCEKAFQSYSKTFVRLLGSVYSNLQAERSGTADGLAFQVFTFGEKTELDWPGDWSEKLRDLVYRQHSAAIRTYRIVRFYEGNTLIIVKPDRLRNWISSTAIRDADETLVDLQCQGF